jgi:sterol desaturase/sphingolipid hydroxylase (fatty acid hydroxylase superfamily)
MLLSFSENPQTTQSANRFLSSVAAFALVMAAAVAFLKTSDWQSALAHQQVSMFKSAFALRTLAGFVEAAAVIAWYLATKIAAFLFILCAFQIAEIIISRRSPSLRQLWLPLKIRIGVFFALMALNPVFSSFAKPLFGETALLSLGAAMMPFPEWVSNIIVFLLSIAAANFGGYWVHRAQHAIPMLWRFHALHHSIEEMNSLNSGTHPIDTIGDVIGSVIIMSLVGFSFETVLLVQSFMSIREQLLHSTATINWGPAGVLFVDNRHHFLHHSRDTRHYGCNFASFVTIWDRIFGTYRVPLAGPLPPTGVDGLLTPHSAAQFLMGVTQQVPAVQIDSR